MNIEVVGVVGAGVMGRGLTQNLAQTNHQVILLDVPAEILEQAKREIEKNVRFQRLFNKSSATECLESTMRRIEFSTSYSRFAEADFVVENVTEKWPIKKEVYERLEVVCPKHTIYAANTSAISITRIASVTERAPQVLGMHFMNPVPMKSTVEVIRGYHTSDETIEIASGLLASMAKRALSSETRPALSPTAC